MLTFTSVGLRVLISWKNGHSVFQIFVVVLVVGNCAFAHLCEMSLKTVALNTSMSFTSSSSFSYYVFISISRLTAVFLGCPGESIHLSSRILAFAQAHSGRVVRSISAHIPVLGPVLFRAQAYWYCYVRLWLFRLLAIVLALTSLLMVWSECTFFVRSPTLSLVAGLVKAQARQDDYFLLEVCFVYCTAMLFEIPADFYQIQYIVLCKLLRA